VGGCVYTEKTQRSSFVITIFFGTTFPQ